MKQKFLGISTLLVVVLNSICAQPNKGLPFKISPLEKSEAAVPASGNGSAGNPYEIANISNLIWLSQNNNYWRYYFIQTADIDISESREWNDGKGFAPIGDEFRSFEGHYNGKGHTINGLFINRTSTNYTGLFGSLFMATIDSLGVTNCEVTGVNRVGGLTGFNGNQSSIRHCYVEGKVNGVNYVGGLAGTTAFNSQVSYCYFSGNVNASLFGGGLAGSNLFASDISDCYSTGHVNGQSYLGSLVGSNEMQSTITDCYASGKVTGNACTAGLAGYDGMSSTLNNCYWNPVSTGQSQAVGLNDDNVNICTGLSPQQMKQPESFTGFDFENAWGILTNRSYPALKVLNNNAPFAFADTISGFARVIPVTSFQSNDYDYETFQHSLTGKILSASSGSFHNDTLYLPASTAIGDTILLNYRAGEIRSERDTLWGNTATGMLIIRNAIPELSAVSNISIPEDTKLVLTLNDMTVKDPDGDTLSILIGYGLNYTHSGDTIAPGAGFNGLLSVDITVSDGKDTSNTLTMLVNVMAVNDAPVVHDTITTIPENTILTVNVYAKDVDGTVVSVSIDRDPEHGTVTRDGLTITYTPGMDFTGPDSFTWYAVDDQGLTSESATVAVTVVAGDPTSSAEWHDQKIILYPNPCPGIFYINAGPKQVQLYIYDLNGKSVFTRWVQDLTQVDISRLERGVYILKVNGMNLQLVRN